MSDTKFQFLEGINLRRLSSTSGVSYAKLYFRKNGRIKEDIDPKDATKIVNALKKDIEPLFKNLGFNIQVERVD